MSRTGNGSYRRRREELRQQRLPCHLCGQPIDYELPSSDPMSFSADHEDAYMHVGEATHLRAAHLSCNKRRGAKPVSSTSIKKRSRQW